MVTVHPDTMIIPAGALKRWQSDGRVVVTGTGRFGVLVERSNRAFLTVELTDSKEEAENTLAPFHAFYDSTTRVHIVEITS